MRPRLNAPTRMRHLSRWPRLAFTPLCTVQIAPLRSHLAHALRLLPISVHGRVTDIWRAYFTQRLLWGCGYRVAFAYPWVTQYRNAHNYLADFNSELPLYQQAGALPSPSLKRSRAVRS